MAKHASVKLYLIFSVILSVITFLEWYVFKYRDELGITSGVMVPALLAMSLVKFVMVVGWYMHLKFDNFLLKFMFVSSLAMGVGTALALGILV